MWSSCVRACWCSVEDLETQLKAASIERDDLFAELERAVLHGEELQRDSDQLKQLLAEARHGGAAQSAAAAEAEALKGRLREAQGRCQELERQFETVKAGAERARAHAAESQEEVSSLRSQLGGWCRIMPSCCMAACSLARPAGNCCYKCPVKAADPSRRRSLPAGDVVEEREALLVELQSLRAAQDRMHADLLAAHHRASPGGRPAEELVRENRRLLEEVAALKVQVGRGG